jgi:hypothetical protein
MAMKLLVGWAMSAGLLVAATVAAAQGLPAGQADGSPYAAASDVGGPYAAMPPEPLPSRDAGPTLLPPQEVYTVLRDNGFSPAGAPQQRGFVYTIAVLDRSGEHGRLVIDARDGRIVRFVPAYALGGTIRDQFAISYGPRVPRPPAPIPHVASRSPTAAPLPKTTPRAAEEPKVEKPEVAAPAPSTPTQQSAVAQVKPAETAAPTVAPPPDAAGPSVKILPTQAMPKAQGLD